MIMDFYSVGHISKEISQILGIPCSTMSTILKRFRKTGRTDNYPRGGRPAIVKERDYRVLKRIVKCNRTDITNKFNKGRIVKVSKRTV